MPKTRVFVDTNVIIEAFRINCWKQLCNAFQIETVESVVAESQAGDSGDARYIEVDESTLRLGLFAIHSVDKTLELRFASSNPDAMRIDQGERDLLAWIWSQGAVPDGHLLISTADKAAINMAGRLGMIDRLKSLQALAGEAGVSKAQLGTLKNQFSASQLITWRTEAILGTLGV